MAKTFWTCTNCNEEVESKFEVCWNCQRDRSGTVPPNFSDLEIEDHGQKLLNAVFKEKFCLACQTDLTYVGKRRFRSESGEDSILDALFGNLTELELFACPACGRVEFFMLATHG
ncbi:MAG TPA: hypothetical protein VFI24_29220 [Pyrinomonadaceae bacterium]|nr:hypothetical protein [Pyrinomonadaceae bacterium]